MTDHDTIWRHFTQKSHPISGSWGHGTRGTHETQSMGHVGHIGKRTAILMNSRPAWGRRGEAKHKPLFLEYTNLFRIVLTREQTICLYLQHIPNQNRRACRELPGQRAIEQSNLCREQRLRVGGTNTAMSLPFFLAGTLFIQWEAVRR